MMIKEPVARYEDLKSRTVFISGGASGIGADVVTAFHQQGSDVVFVDIAREQGEAIAKALSATGPEVTFLPCDVTDISALNAALQIAESRGDGIDVLVNNAANDARIPMSDVSEADWDRLINVNLKHQFFAAQTACTWMKTRLRGSIINLASIAPEVMVEDLAIYSACKSAVRGITRSIARDMGAYGIRANSVLPGAILTERQRGLWFNEQSAVDDLVAKQCLKKELCGRDVAEMVLFLASDVSAACTAQNFIVDGGTV